MALSLRRPTSQRTASPNTAADALRPRWRQRRRRRSYALSLLLVVVVGLTLFMMMLQWQWVHVLEVVAPPTTSVPTRTYTSPPPRTHVARRSSATSFPVPPANILRTTKKADEDVADSLHVGTFTVVMVLHTWQDVRGQLLATLDRWSRYFFRSGLVQHAHLLELLLYIPITTQHTRTAAEVAELVIRRWAVEDAETLKQCGHDDDHHHHQQQQQQGNRTDTKWQRWRKLVRVVVAPAPRHSSEKLAAMQAPAQLFAAVEAVRSEYVVVADLRWLPPPSHTCNTSSSHVHDDQHVSLGALMSMGLQALSRNELADLPILLDEDTPLHVDDVDVFRLAHTPMALPSHTHTLTKANNNTDAPQLLAQRWSAFMRYLRREYNNDNNISHDTQHMPMRQMVMQEAPLPSWWRHAAVLDGLPARHYGTSLAYHCAAAPRYALQLPLAPFLRPTTAHHHHHHPRTSATDAHHVSFVPMCEVLISRWSGMDEFVGPPLLFHTHICDAWRRWVFVDGEVGDADRAAPSTSVLAPPTTSPGEKDALRTLLYRPPTTNHCGTLCCFHWSMEWKRALLRARKRHGRGPRVRMDESAHIGSAGVAAFAELLWPRPRINRTAEELKVEALQSLRHFLPPSMHANLSHAHNVLRQRISAKVDPIHVKYVVEQRRRQKLRRRAGDAAVVCLPSNSCAVDGAPMMFRTRWYLERMAMRCRRRRHECMGDENTTPQRSMDMMAYYLGRTGRWSKGAYRVCSGAGGFIYDPDQVLP